MPQNELERLAAVNRFLHLDFSKEKELQEIVNLAAQICHTPFALITLLDENTQYVKFRFGTDLETTDRKDAFCNHAIAQQQMMVVPDAQLDPRFANNPLVTGGLGIRFYAGSPITTQDGNSLGSLCVIGREAQELTPSQQQMLHILSKQVIHLLEFDSSLNILKQQFIQAKNAEIRLRSFFESSASCHLLLGKNLEVLAFNKALADSLAETGSEAIAIGMKITPYIHHSYAEQFLENYQKALTGVSTRFERLLPAENGTTIYWYITFDPARDEEGRIIGVSNNATDITTRVAQERRVLSQNEALKKIAYIQSHEVRRPVASILGLIDLFKQEDYVATREELMMLEQAAMELDEKIQKINKRTEEE